MIIKAVKYWWLVGIKGLVILILGLLAMAFPIEITQAAVLTSALLIGIGGLILLSVAFLNAHHYMRKWFFLEGLLDMLGAFLIATNAILTATILSVIFGVWLLTNSLFRLHLAFQRRKINRDWKMSFANGILTLVLSVALIIHPESGLFSFGMLLGIILISYGTFLLSTSFHRWGQKT